MRYLVVLWVLALGGCDSDAGGIVDDLPGGGGDPDDSDGGDDEEQGPAPVRFVVMGDTGEGTETQREVADAIEEACDDLGCDFVVLLGDNIYDDGVDSVDDPDWEYRFEAPYEDLDLPFYAVLGNHDYGGKLVVPMGGVGNEWWKGPLEVQYTEHSDKWLMPATHYTFTWENVGFVAIDTNALMWGNVEHGDQLAWYGGAVGELEAAGVDWILGVGHHPYLSNGSHGNAGNYEGIEVGGQPIPNPVPTLNGARLKQFFETVMCGTVDLYFSGHDHNRQWLSGNGAFCGAELVVSGAGAKVTALRGRGNESYYEDDATEGFLHVTIEGKQLTGRFIDRTGATNYERTITKP